MAEELKEVIDAASDAQEEKVDESTTEKKPKESKEPEAEKPEETKEDIESLPEWAKARLEKLESDKENYKKGMLKYKKHTLEPKKKETKEEPEEEYPDWDETSKKFQKQTLTQAEKKAEAKAQAIIEKANEKSAINKFLSEHPDMDDKWDDVVSNYSPKNGKETIEDIIKDLERAYVLTRYESGELDKPDNAEKKGKAKLAEMSSVSKTTSRNVPEGKTLSEASLRMAKAMRVDPKQLAKEDDSPYAEIKL